MKKLLLLMLCFLSSVFTQTNADQYRKLLPSEALALTYSAMNADLTGNRMAIIGHILPRVITENQKGDELFALGDLYFWNFKPKESAEAFEAFMDEDGLRGRSAWQRMLQIKFRAFEKHEEVETLIKAYRKKFKAIPEDRYAMFGQIWNVASRYEKMGEYKKVVQLVEEELASLKYDAAYRSFILPAIFFKSYSELGKINAARKHLEVAAENLKKTLSKRKAAMPEKVLTHVVHSPRVANMLTPYQEKLGYAQENEKFEKLIESLKQSIKRFDQTK